MCETFICGDIQSDWTIIIVQHLRFCTVGNQSIATLKLNYMKVPVHHLVHGSFGVQ